MGEPLLFGLGIAAATYATFTVVSYLEVRNKIEQQISLGEDPYELQVERKERKKPQQKKKNSIKRRS